MVFRNEHKVDEFKYLLVFQLKTFKYKVMTSKIMQNLQLFLTSESIGHMNMKSCVIFFFSG